MKPLVGNNLFAVRRNVLLLHKLKTFVGLRKYSLDLITEKSKQLSFYHRPCTKPLLSVTIADYIDRAATKYGDRLAIVDCEQSIRKTFGEYVTEINLLATGLLALNLQKGDRIGIWSPNRYEWALTQMAAAKAGLILVTINPVYQPNELAHCLSTSGIKALVTQESFKILPYYKMVNALIPEIATSKPGQIKSERFPAFTDLIVMTDSNLPGSMKFSDVMTAGGNKEKRRLEELQSEIQMDDIVQIQFTSGTTGVPKATALTNFASVNGAIELYKVLNYFEEGHVLCCQVPLFHTFGCGGGTAGSIFCGYTCVLPSMGYSPEASIKSIVAERCTIVYGTPTMYIDLLNHPSHKKSDLSSLRTGIIGGAPCPPELFQRVVEELPCPELTNVYGATEISPIVSAQNRRDPIEIKLNNVGRILPDVQIKIVDGTNRIVPFGTAGEICARGTQVMHGYWGDEAKTKEVVKNGWYHTGDLGILSEDGTLTVVGRCRDMIIRGGENIFPKEIEDLLMTHPHIKEVAVFGVPDERYGEAVGAWIILKEGHPVSKTEINEFCVGKIAKYKIPNHVTFVSELPKTASGKVQKHVIQAEMEKALRKK